MTTEQLKVRLIKMIGAQDDLEILRQIELLLAPEGSGQELTKRVSEGEQAITKGLYREAEEAKNLVQERIARKYGK